MVSFSPFSQFEKSFVKMPRLTKSSSKSALWKKCTLRNYALDQDRATAYR